MGRGPGILHNLLILEVQDVLFCQRWQVWRHFDLIDWGSCVGFRSWHNSWYAFLSHNDRTNPWPKDHFGRNSIADLSIEVDVTERTNGWFPLSRIETVLGGEGRSSLTGGVVWRLTADERAVCKITISRSHKAWRVNIFHSQRKLHASCPSAAIHVSISTHENPSIDTMKEHDKALSLLPKQRYLRSLICITIPPPSRKQPTRKPPKSYLTRLRDKSSWAIQPDELANLTPVEEDPTTGVIMVVQSRN